MKINNPVANKNSIGDILCPVCKSSDVVSVASVTVNGTPLLLHAEIGEVWQCMNPECWSYFLKVNGEFKPIERMELLRRQKEITDLLVAEQEVSRARFYPRAMEVVVKAEMAEALSSLLYHLTAESQFHRSYGIEEIIEACDSLGFNPREVGSRRIGFVLTWLKENKS
jgi:hypothetical protein